MAVDQDAPGDVLVDREHRQVQADDHRPDDGAHDDDHDRLDGGGQRLGRLVDLAFVEVRDLVEHRADLAGLLADLDHLHDHRREDRVGHATVPTSADRCGRRP